MRIQALSDLPAALTVGGIIIVSLAIIAATFPILTRITGPEVTRND